MRFLLPLALAVCALAADKPPVDPPPVKVDKKIILFNGKNLDNWYVWTQPHQYADPKKVFNVENKVIHVSGEEWGGIATVKAYRDYHLIVEWKWGEKTWASRADKSRDSGILVHGVGEDGAYGRGKNGEPGIWLESIESQIIEGGAGDIILVGGKNRPKMTAQVRKDTRPGKREVWWQKGGEEMPRQGGRFNWFGRDPDWKDVKGFRGAKDVEKPTGQWNRHEVICDGDTVTNIINGVVVNYGYNSDHTFGKIQLQSEGAEIFFRRIELHPIKKHVSYKQ